MELSKQTEFSVLDTLHGLQTCSEPEAVYTVFSMIHPFCHWTLLSGEYCHQS